MKLKKITTGFVIQSYDTDKEAFTDQEFVAGDECVWEDEIGDSVDALASEYLPYDMVQPNDLSKEKIDDIKEVLRMADSFPAQKLLLIQQVLETNC